MPLAALTFSPPSLFACALIGYALMMWSNPARASFRDGLRALRRYPAMGLIPGFFGFCAALFMLAQRAYFAWVSPSEDGPAFVWLRDSFWWLPREDLLRALRESRLPAFETLAGIFNCLTATFPVSALAAILLLINLGGHHRVLHRALRKRFGIFGWAAHFGIVVCALAAIAKPLLYLAPQLLGLSLEASEAWMQWSQVVVWLSFLFEYLCGLFVQTYLILLAFIWVRGLTFTRDHLIDFSIRRFSSVAKWAGVIMVLSTVFIDAPLMLRNFAPLAGWFPDPIAFAHRLATARLTLAVFALLFATMQITLVFHGESLAAALRDHREFLRHHWWPFAWFLIVATLHCFALCVVQHAVELGLGKGSAAWVAWSLLFPWIAGGVAAWMLASWVCVYKRCATPAQSDATQTMFRF